jgi:hypothetical protein
MSGIDGWGHVGGLITGVIAAWIAGAALPAPTPDMSPESALREQRPPARVFAELLLMAVLVLVISVALIAWNPAGA